MTGLTLEAAQTQLEAWLAASAAIAGGQSYRISGTGVDRTLTRADAGECRQMIDYWNRMVTSLTPGRVRRIHVIATKGV